MWRAVLPLLMLWILAAPAMADSANVVLGRTDCFVVRNPGTDASIADRVSRIQSVFTRHLGRTPGDFAIRSAGARRLISLDGDFIVAVTPADAQATHHESAATLAPVWRDQLRRAWEESTRPSSVAAPATASPGRVGPGGPDAYILFLGATLMAMLVMVAILLRIGRQATLLVQQSQAWQRETSESLLLAARPPAALPAPEGMALSPAMEGEVTRVAREQSQAAVNEAIQQICDSVERVMAGLLEEMARGMHRAPSPETVRESILAGAGRAAMPRSDSPANGGEVVGENAPLPRRGPTTLEITALGKTYAFPMAPERAQEVMETWESGGAVPEAWLHESGITTARLQPLLDRFILRRQSSPDGTNAYAFDPRGSAASFAIRNAP